jgi:hypothetical protein
MEQEMYERRTVTALSNLYLLLGYRRHLPCVTVQMVSQIHLNTKIPYYHQLVFSYLVKCIN